ncbi:MAG: DUF4956 domain-containing protein [Lachnospiraceae bacterium]|nr:DUF4956 domain-containing protein [Lachnospiraceae bacterium]
MLNTIINSIIGSADISIIQFMVPILSALILGFILAKVSMGDNRSSKGFIVTLALLPAIVCVVIMAVNGNIGAGVAVAGAFSLVRFRSAQGTAKEIAGLFMAMTIGLLTGMGYVFYAFIFELIMIAVMVLYRAMDFGSEKKSELTRSLRITIPEDLDYTGVFDEIFEEFTIEHALLSAKTSSMGSMFKLDYDVVLKSADVEKKFIDKLRCRNGNLEIAISSLKRHESAEL